MMEPTENQDYVAIPAGLYGLMLRYLQRDVDKGIQARADALQELKTHALRLDRKKLHALKKE